MTKCTLLVLDGLGNVGLGLLLLLFPAPIIIALGAPPANPPFYASLFGAVLIGIGLALLLESRSADPRARGLGLGGAVLINTCFGLTLIFWLLFGALQLPVRGLVILWALAAVLLGLSLVEVLAHVPSWPQQRGA